MSSRVDLVLTSRDVRERAIRWIDGAPKGTRVRFAPPQRSIDQNARMWAMLTDIVTQSPQFDGTRGRKYTTDQAKVVFMHACGMEAETLPALDGWSFIPYFNQSSSDLGVAEMSNLIEFMFAWGAENGLVWSDPKERRQREGRAA